MTASEFKKEITDLRKRATMTCAFLSNLSLFAYLVTAYIGHRTGVRYPVQRNKQIIYSATSVTSRTMESGLRRLRSEDPELYNQMPEFLDKQVDQSYINTVRSEG